jgi:hypothetical protein
LAESSTKYWHELSDSSSKDPSPNIAGAKLAVCTQISRNKDLKPIYLYTVCLPSLALLLLGK